MAVEGQGWLIEPGVKGLDYLAQVAHENARAKGFWEEGDFNMGEKLALIHSELSEALEEHRGYKPTFYVDVTTGKPEGSLVELADVLIRTLDLMRYINGDEGYSIEEIVLAKMNYNATRPHKHGKAY
jgi:NTP pyrophosphatase (non-canonical NTP hydrolase)